MHLKETSTQGHIVLELSGELDLLCATELRAALKSILARGSPGLILDLTALSFMDSSGLSELIAYQQAAQGLQGDLVIVCGAGEVRELFALSQLERYFRIFTSFEDACAHRRQQGDVSRESQ